MRFTKPWARFDTCFLILCVMTALGTASIAQTRKENPRRYKVVDLGTLGGSFSWGLALNSRGDVVGISTTGGDVSLHAFLWSRGLMTDLGTLGSPDTLPISTAVSINNAGEIVGVSEINETDPLGENSCGDFLICLPVVWQNNAIRALPTLGGTNGVANDVNESGVIGGLAESDALDPACAPFQILHLEPVIWKQGQIHQLPSFGGDQDGFVLALNDAGDAVGLTIDCTHNAGHNVVWLPEKVVDMNAAGGDLNAEPNDINNRRQVTGTAWDSNGSASALLWQDGVTKSIGRLPGHAETHGNAINDNGQIVGQSCAPSGWPDCSVFLWDNGTMRDLNDLVSDSSLTLVESGKINDLSQIVGLAFTTSGELHGFLATPDTGGEQVSPALPKALRSIVALPELVQKTVDGHMHQKFHGLGRGRPLQSPR